MAIINLFGASGHAKVIMDIIKAQGNKIGCLYDDNPSYSELHGLPVYKASDKNVDGPLIVSIGSSDVRKQVVSRYRVAFSIAIHPSAVVSPSATIDEGTVIMPGAIVNADAQIGSHVIINTKASVGHDCKIESFAHIAPGVTLAGNVHIGSGSWIGVGSSVKQGINIGANCLIGAGSVVVKDIPDNSVAYGNPCIIHKK